MSLVRPLQYTAVRVDAAVSETTERWGQCHGCYRRCRVRQVELLQRSRRAQVIHWIPRDLCGECTAVVLSNEIGMDIPSLSTG